MRKNIKVKKIKGNVANNSIKNTNDIVDKNKSLISCIELSAFHNSQNDLIKIDIPISAIEILEINKISTSILYLKDGKYDEIDECGSLELRLIIDKLEKDAVKLLLEDICIFSINLFFENGNKKYYNLPFYSSYGSNNDLQQINKKDNKIIIYLNEK